MLFPLPTALLWSIGESVYFRWVPSSCEGNEPQLVSRNMWSSMLLHCTLRLSTPLPSKTRLTPRVRSVLLGWFFSTPRKAVLWFFGARPAEAVLGGFEVSRISRSGRRLKRHPPCGRCGWRVVDQEGSIQRDMDPRFFVKG